MKLYILDSKTLIMILRKLEPRLSGANALQHFLMVRIGQYNRLVGRKDGKPYWPDPATWVENAWEFVVDDEHVDDLAEQWGVIPLKDCFVTDESLIKSLSDRFLELTDLVLSRYGTLPEVRDKVISLLDEWEVDPREAERIRKIEDLFELSSYLVSRAENKGQFSEEPPVERKKTAQKSKSAGPAGPAMPDVNVNLLPDIVRQQGWDGGVRYAYDPQKGSPLLQLVKERRDQRFLLLYGELDSGVAGAGKTTALRQLLREGGETLFAYVPLWEVYNPFAMRRLKHEVGTLRVLEWLEAQGQPVEPDVQKILLLDGLDEIVAGESIRAFCDDLTVLAEDDRFALVLSSVLSPDQLPNWSNLSKISSLLTRFVKCCIQPLRPEQRQACLGGRAADYPQALATPRQVSLFMDVSFAEAEQRDLFFRWVSEKKPSGHGTSLFYRSLAAQICSWFRADPVNDAQNERDSFMLMFALPAVAFRMVMNEIYDERYAPEVRPMDAGTVDRLLRLAFPVYKQSLHRYGFYNKFETALATLADSLQDVGAEGLLSEKTGAILCRSFNPVTMEYGYHFPNRAMRDGLAALHLANLFCFAIENLLPTGPEFDEFYTCPVRFLPQNLLESAAVLVDERLQTQSTMHWILENGPFRANGDPNPFCSYIIRSLGAAFCTALRSESEGRWRTEAEWAYKELLRAESRMAENCAMDYVANLCVQSRMFRAERKYQAAAERAGDSIRLAQRLKLLNADGYQALAMLYLTQVKDSLNLHRAWEDCGIPIPKADLDRATGIFEELQRLAQLPEIRALESEKLAAPPAENDPNTPDYLCRLRKMNWLLAQPPEPGPLESEVFGTLTAESVPLIPDCICLLEKAKLRLDAYKLAEFFGSREVEFLLTASFVAKAHSVWAALSPATSGAAINLLAGFFENDQELLENDPTLPFFAANPQFHLSIDPGMLSYTNRDCRAARLYLRIIRLRRGFQPYSCRNLAQALLSRRFRLDEHENPIPADGVEKELSATERDFLDEITYRAATRLRPTYAIPRIRWLHEQIEFLSQQPGKGTQIAACREEAAALFRREWTLGSCGDKLDSRSDTKADLLAEMMAGLYREGYLPDADPVSWTTKINDYRFRCKSALKRYALGDSFR